MGAETKACFRVTGRFLTAHARDRVFEFGWEDGLRFLSAALPELSYEQASGVMAGRLRLTGNSTNGVGLADERPKARGEAEDRYRWLHAGVLYDRPSKKCWRPYAFVTGWGPDDMIPNRTQNRYHPKPHRPFLSVYCGGDPASWGLFRCVRYMDDPVEDRVWNCPVPGREEKSLAVLFKEVPRPPPWWLHLTDPVLAVAEYLRAGLSLSERGDHLERAREREFEKLMEQSDAKPVRSEKVSVAPPPPITEPSHSLIRELLDARGLDGEVADGLLRALTDTAEYVLPEPTTDVTKARWAWVDRDGNLWPCRGYMDHIPLADALCRKFHIDPRLYKDNPSYALESRGWGKVGWSNLGEPYAAYTARVKQTQALGDRITEWLLHHAKNHPDTLARWVKSGDGFDY